MFHIYEPDQLDREHPYVAIFARLAGIVVGFSLCALLGSCATFRKAPSPTPVTVTIRDTVHHTITQRDSIYLHDSIYKEVTVRGDTVTMLTDRWHTAFRDRLIRDTLYIHQADTITQIYQQPTPTTMQRFKKLLSDIAFDFFIILFGIIAILGIFWYRGK